jgi:hypothetical protein
VAEKKGIEIGDGEGRWKIKGTDGGTKEGEINGMGRNRKGDVAANKG